MKTLINQNKVSSTIEYPSEKQWVINVKKFLKDSLKALDIRVKQVLKKSKPFLDQVFIKCTVN